MVSAPAPSEVPQYSLTRIVLVWAAAAVPMGLLGWIGDPLLRPRLDPVLGIPGSTRVVLLAAGLAWQMVLVLILVRREAGRLDWTTLRDRLWLGPPRDPATGNPSPRLWLWAVVGIALFVVSVFLLAPVIDRAWVRLVPFLAEPPAFSLGQMLGPPNDRLLVGAWWFYALFILLAVLNTILGEELLFRGVLLPRMQGAFGRWDWLANGVLFGLYHLHQPWGIPSSIVDGALLFAWPSRRFRSAWIGIVVHSAQSVFFGLILLRVVLGSG